MGGSPPFPKTLVWLGPVNLERVTGVAQGMQRCEGRPRHPDACHPTPGPRDPSPPAPPPRQLLSAFIQPFPRDPPRRGSHLMWSAREHRQHDTGWEPGAPPPPPSARPPRGIEGREARPINRWGSPPRWPSALGGPDAASAPSVWTRR